MGSGLRQNDGLSRHSGRAPAPVIRNPFSTRFNIKMDSGQRQNDGLSRHSGRAPAQVIRNPFSTV
jgi:hypothetical protein